MGELRVKPYVLRLFVTVFVLFVLNKFVLRPIVLGHDFPIFLKIIVLSVPNTFEAIFAMVISSGLLMMTKFRHSPRFDRIPNPAIYLLALALAGTYVLTQEFKLHNLGGNNVYDPYDVVASVIGLVGMLLLFCRLGVAEPVSQVE